MAIAWYASQYKRRAVAWPSRYPIIRDFAEQIQADDGFAAFTEILGDYCIVKVQASSATLTLIDGTTGIFAVPKRWTSLTSSLSDMTSGERNQIQSLVLSLGYTQQELDAAMGSTLTEWRQKTLQTLLDFMATRRLRPRYDEATDTILLDGPEQPVTPVEYIDAQVQ